MSLREFFTRNVVTGLGNETILDAAKRMRDRKVGAIVVVDDEQKPIGMVTDRDLVVKAMAEGKNPQTTLLRETMSFDLVSLDENRGLFEATKIMSNQGIRRVPVVDKEGKLAGIICLDDLIMVFGQEIAGVAGAIAYETFGTPGKKLIVA